MPQPPVSTAAHKWKKPEVTKTPGFFVWCRLQDLNPPPHDYKSSALPDELSRLKISRDYTLFNPGKLWFAMSFGWVGIRLVVVFGNGRKH